MFPPNPFYSSVPQSIESSCSNHFDQWPDPKPSPVSFEGLPCLLNVECHDSLVGGEVDRYAMVGGLEGLDVKMESNVKGVDCFIEKMGLKVVNC